MTDKDGQIVASYEYDSWGNVVKNDTKGIAADNPFGYAGYMYDKEIGMYYLIARYYQPEHGVFLSVDPDPGDEDDPITMNGNHLEVTRKNKSQIYRRDSAFKRSKY
ncbi:hypothetical protein OCA11_17585 [Bacillus cereus]|uniref:RHS repeat-associated core domain-containing protein n=1 Tax=Bacillus thuringiensis TaxID=1428 RepID=A0AAW9JIT6_BACTU|nr:RHS repeat-associated core domain-containing protein [Bacillus thuringiensis]MCU5186053.1 hypothetical protein [Bacillus cereus]MDZ5480563.1 RHS repeat-associated core domain-containing protein [Bacillus thuringiensis]